MIYVSRQIRYTGGSITFDMYDNYLSVVICSGGKIVHTQMVSTSLQNTQVIDILIVENRDKYHLGELTDDYIKVAHYGKTNNIFIVRKIGFNIEVMYSSAKNVYKFSTHAIAYSDVDSIVCLCISIINVCSYW